MKWGYGLAVVLIGGVVLTSLSFAKTVVEPQFAVALAQENVNTIAEEITVMIDGANDDQQGKGSGVIIGREGNIYYVLTNTHVIEKDGDYQVQTVDGIRYVVNYRQIQKLPGLDLAVVQFSSNQNYRVAKLGNSDQVSRRQKIYVVGYATPGVVFTDRQFIPAEGMILDRVSDSKDGYALVYSLNLAQRGMSGGPVLDEQGQLIGINGLAQRDETTGRADLILGIPTNNFRTRLVEIVPVSTQPTPTLTPTPTPTPTPTRDPGRFYCGRTTDGRFATVVSHPNRDSLTMIIWENNEFANSVWSPEQQCKEVSARFNNFQQSGQLRNIIAGKINNLPVVCAVPNENSRCSSNNVLMTFRSEEDAKQFIKKIIQLTSNSSSEPFVFRSSPTPTPTRAPGRFYCAKTTDGRLATLASHPTRGSVTLIIWESLYESTETGFIEQRCKEVSARFDNFQQSGQLSYIIAGTVNNLPVVCAVPNQSSRCSYNNVLMTFSSEKDAKQFIEQINRLNSGISNSPFILR
ncbi:hypothetical protein BCD67_07580 [Oscillatoriales cyanobacterium USR001]|nr:hypothetical protein BCD67_07580 [Oscillatoriales cyanobacterium USR001]